MEVRAIDFGILPAKEGAMSFWPERSKRRGHGARPCAVDWSGARLSGVGDAVESNPIR